MPPRASGSANKGLGIVLLVMVAAMALLLAHGLYATLAGPQPDRAKPSVIRSTAPAPAETASRHEATPAPKAQPAAAAATDEAPARSRFTRGTM
jgi:hypothetical protein